MSIIKWIRDMFGVERQAAQRVGAVRRAEGARDDAQKSRPAATDYSRGGLAVIVTRFIGIALLLSLVAIIGLTIAYPERETPPVLIQVVSATLGYFGGALAGYMRSDASS